MSTGRAVDEQLHHESREPGAPPGTPSEGSSVSAGSAGPEGSEADVPIEVLLTRTRGARAGAGCPVETAVRALDGKWTMLIVRELLVGPRRYGELAAALPHVSPKTLVERLRYLEGQGVIARTAYPERPRRVEYRLTPIGEDLAAVVRELWRWGARLQGTAQA